jgi:hypothetical protein
MTAAEIIKSGLPWLRLDIKFNHDVLLEEARRQEFRYVRHRGNGRGWKSICLHGIGSECTLAASEYGFENEAKAPHRWTDVADECPETKRFIQSLPYNRFFRVRYMLLEPGGFIAPHRDADVPRLGPINAALNHPPGCVFKLEKAGIIPFVPGSAFLIDVSNRHALINASRFPRFHLIIHGVPDETNSVWTDLLRRSYDLTTGAGLSP